MALTKAGKLTPDGSPDGSPDMPMPPRQIEIVQEADGGKIEVEREFVPPQYNPEWGQALDAQQRLA